MQPITKHLYFSHQGTTIFVKLWQMRETEKDTLHVDTNDLTNWKVIEGRETCPLFRNPFESVRLQTVAAVNVVCDLSLDATEILVVTGSVKRDGINQTLLIKLRNDVLRFFNEFCSNHHVTSTIKFTV
ncbi:hypothetical protein [Photobacterium sp. GB-72]|uniref:hypothetical protein n=1 Tax=Photobacterium sp. GB-72 TaxID=2022105 RepID=UPI001E49A031|nr:hypothetical protein [Photobacterium sp. GB-72]